MENSQSHGFQIRDHLIVGESQHAIALPFDESRALLVKGGTTDMSQAIDFDDQPLCGAAEVNDIRANHGLPTKLEIAELALSKKRPQDALWLRRLMTHFCSASAQSRTNSVQSFPPPW
jgi:hypothetical protein